MLSENFYWLSNDKTQYDWKKTTYQFTPVSHYVDLTALQTLPKATIDVQGAIMPSPDGPVAHLQVKNPSDHLAFQGPPRDPQNRTRRRNPPRILGKIITFR